jgi:molecular chaperone DnaK (HSP70)
MDLGPTNTVVAHSDRGGSPAVSFDGGDTFPLLVAVKRAGGEIRSGPAAKACRHVGTLAVARSAHPF